MQEKAKITLEQERENKRKEEKKIVPKIANLGRNKEEKMKICYYFTP